MLIALQQQTKSEKLHESYILPLNKPMKHVLHNFSH